MSINKIGILETAFVNVTVPVCLHGKSYLAECGLKVSD